MSTSLLIHPTGASLVSLNKSNIVTARTPLALASRFPKNCAPSAVVSETTGHVWVWSEESAVVWEYDARARRISEFSAGGKVQAMCWVVADSGKDGVAVCVGAEVRVMEKEGGKWDGVRSIGTPHPVVALCASRDGAWIAMMNKSGDLSFYDRKTEVSRTVGIPSSFGKLNGALMHFALSLPLTLVIPTDTHLLLVDVETHHIKEINPFSQLDKRILDLAFSPVQEGSDGKRRGGLCGVLLEGGEVALIGLDQPESVPKMVIFGQSITGVSFLDGATLAGHTSTGTLLLKDLRALADPPVEVDIPERVLSIHPLPSIPRSSSRASLAQSASATVKRTPFGESRNSDNLPTPPPVPVLDKGKAKAREISRTVEISKTETVRTAEIHIPISASAQGEGRWASHSGLPAKSALKTKMAPPEPQDKARNVSAPTSSSSHAKPASRARASLPGPMARSASESALASGSRPAPRSSTLAGLAEVIEEEDENRSAPLDAADDIHQWVGLEWAMVSPTARQTTRVAPEPQGSKTPAHSESGSASMVDDLRRDMWGLQMEMLRMNRSLKAEIRHAVEPLKMELEQSRAVIEAQRREIERLRRGY